MDNREEIYSPSEVEQLHQVDPFYRYPGTASRVHGVAGDDPLPFEGYVFHSAPIEVPSGLFRFTLHLSNLQAGPQILLLEVLNRSSASGSTWSRLKIMGVHLSDIAANGGKWHIDVRGWSNVQYACVGYIHDEGTVSAERLLLTVDKQFLAVTRSKPTRAPQSSTATRSSNIEARPRIAGSQIPSFVNPTSQPWTSGQTCEPAFREQLVGLARGERALSDPWVWAEPIILQIFDRYRALFTEARGMAVDMENFVLAACVLERCCLLTSVKIQTDFASCLDVGAALDAIARTNSQYSYNAFRAMNVTAVDPINIPDEFGGEFDFSWWIAPRSTTCMNVTNVLRLVMKGLRPGGITVLVVPFSKTASSSSDELGALTRADIERLALYTISHGHDVAQLRFNTPEEDGTVNPVPYAFIARRGEGGDQ